MRIKLFDSKHSVVNTRGPSARTIQNTAARISTTDSASLVSAVTITNQRIVTDETAQSHAPMPITTSGQWRSHRFQ